jgi:hypothetical protein
MAVNVQRYRDAVMAEPLLHNFRMHIFRQKVAGVAVTQAMQTKR